MIRPTALFLLLVSPVAAQEVTLDFATVGVAGVYVDTEVRASAADQAITAAEPLFLDLFEFISSPFPGFSLGSTTAHVSERGGARLEQTFFQFDLGGFGGPFGGGGGGNGVPAGTSNSSVAVQAPQSYALNFAASVPISGRIRIEHHLNADAATIAAGTLAGLGSPIDLSTSVTTDVPITLDTAGLALSLSLELGIDGGESSRSLHIWFEADPLPGTCTFTSVADSCAAGGTIGATSVNFVSFEELTIDLAGSLPNGFAITFLSSEPTLSDLPFPFPTDPACQFLSPDMHVFNGASAMFTDGSGNSQMTLRVSPAVLGSLGDFYLQSATLGFSTGLDIVSSNVLEITCP